MPSPSYRPFTTCPNCCKPIQKPLASGRQSCGFCGWKGNAVAVALPNLKNLERGKTQKASNGGKLVFLGLLLGLGGIGLTLYPMREQLLKMAGLGSKESKHPVTVASTKPVAHSQKKTTSTIKPISAFPPGVKTLTTDSVPAPRKVQPVLIASALPPDLERQVRSKTLTRSEAEQLAAGYRRTALQPQKVSSQAITQTPSPVPGYAQRTPMAAMPSEPVGGMVAGDCPYLITSDVGFHFVYDPLQDGPRYGERSVSEMISMVNGQAQGYGYGSTSSGRPGSLGQALRQAVANAVNGGSLSQPSCGAPTGSLTVQATNHYSNGQWEAKVTLSTTNLR
jgi:hypothetical protein